MIFITLVDSRFRFVSNGKAISDFVLEKPREIIADYFFLVSHHPPISANYVANRQDGFTISATILAKSKVKIVTYK